MRRALEAQDAEESWTDEERRALSAHIEEGYLQAERGELVDGAQAQRDIQDIAEDNQDAADSVEQAIYDACAFLAAGSPTRSSPTGSYNTARPLLDAQPSAFLSSGLKGRFPEAKTPTFTDTLDKMKHFVEAV